jgi:hypothetical protein
MAHWVIAYLLTFDSFLKTAEVDDIFGLLFLRIRSCINFGKNGFGYILGDFFTNSSRHSGWLDTL